MLLVLRTSNLWGRVWKACLYFFFPRKHSKIPFQLFFLVDTLNILCEPNKKCCRLVFPLLTFNREVCIEWDIGIAGSDIETIKSPLTFVQHIVCEPNKHARDANFIREYRYIYISSVRHKEKNIKSNIECFFSIRRIYIFVLYMTDLVKHYYGS